MYQYNATESPKKLHNIYLAEGKGKMNDFFSLSSKAALSLLFSNVKIKYISKERVQSVVFKFLCFICKTRLLTPLQMKRHLKCNARILSLKGLGYVM